MAQGSSYRGGTTPTRGRNAGQLDRMADEAEDVAGRVAERGREMGRDAQDALVGIKRSVDRSLKEQPYTTLGMAVVIGFILGALWKS